MSKRSSLVKRLPSLLAVFVILALLAGCAAPVAPAAPAPAAGSDVTDAAATEAAPSDATGDAAAGDRIPVVFWQFSTDEPQIAAYEKAIEEFEKLHPEIDVQMEIVPWSSQQQALTTGLTTGELPDVSMLGNNVVAQYQAIGALLPLTDYFQQWSEEVGSDVTADFWPGDTYYYQIDGDWWGSPVGVETRNLWYRTDLFEAAGLGAEPPQTWEQLREYANALTTDEVYGFGIPGAVDYPTIQTFMNVYLGYGARFLNDQGQCGFDSQEFRDALQFYTDLYLVDPVTPPDTPTYSAEQLRQMFTEGKLAMYIDGPWFWNDITAANPEWIDSVKVAPVPAGPAGQYGFLGGWPLVLWKNSQNPDAAWEWIKFATDPEGGLPIITAGGALPPGRQAIAGQWLDNYTDPNVRANMQTFLDALQIAQPYQYPDAEIPQMGTLEVDAVQTAVQGVMLGQSIDEATAALCERINSELAR
jgi:ABC-type glycerol-3-phosphate transport system substrate-binding protein